MYLRLESKAFSNGMDVRCGRNREDKKDSNVLAVATERMVLLLRQRKWEESLFGEGKL